MVPDNVTFTKESPLPCFVDRELFLWNEFTVPVTFQEMSNTGPDEGV